jgi:hypothetical protein
MGYTTFLLPHPVRKLSTRVAAVDGVGPRRRELFFADDANMDGVFDPTATVSTLALAFAGAEDEPASPPCAERHPTTARLAGAHDRRVSLRLERLVAAEGAEQFPFASLPLDARRP